jgi:hypothetical protein
MDLAGKLKDAEDRLERIRYIAARKDPELLYHIECIARGYWTGEPS